MHSLAISMQKQGHIVTGSDDEIYEPSRSRLASFGLLPPVVGWRPEIVTPDIDLIVLGMHARQDNPELLRARSLNLLVQSFPEFVYHLAENKKRVVVAGSHGKTTTSGMIAHVLAHAGVDADRMIGAAIGELEPVKISDADKIILEGDEYLSSPEDSRPKFLHYRPHITVITGIAWDHMNVFPTYQSYMDPFRQLIQSQRKDDVLIYSQDDADLVNLVKEIHPDCRLIPYSMHPYQIADGMVSLPDTNDVLHPLKIFGIHNMQNLQAAKWVCSLLGVSDSAFYAAIAQFEGASKRLQSLYAGDNTIAYLDFAHAPSKVKATLHAVREKHRDDHITAILELHTFSSLNPDFLPQYDHALKGADVQYVYFSPHTLAIKKLPDLSAAQLATFFNEPALKVATDAAMLTEMLAVSPKSKRNILLWMSSGRFDGLDLIAVSKSYDRRND